MKLETLVNNQAHLQTLANLKFEDIQLAWDLADIYEVIEKAIQKFQSTRDTYLAENGTPQEGQPGRYIVEDGEKVNAYIKKLLDVDVKVEFPKIELSKFKGLQVSISELKAWKEMGIVEKPNFKKDEKK